MVLASGCGAMSGEGVVDSSADGTAGLLRKSESNDEKANRLVGRARDLEQALAAARARVASRLDRDRVGLRADWSRAVALLRARLASSVRVSDASRLATALTAVWDARTLVWMSMLPRHKLERELNTAVDVCRIQYCVRRDVMFNDSGVGGEWVAIWLRTETDAAAVTIQRSYRGTRARRCVVGSRSNPPG